MRLKQVIPPSPFLYPYSNPSVKMRSLVKLLMVSCSVLPTFVRLPTTLSSGGNAPAIVKSVANALKLVAEISVYGVPVTGAVIPWPT